MDHGGDADITNTVSAIQDYMELRACRRNIVANNREMYLSRVRMANPVVEP